MVVIVDYNTGNCGSIRNMLRKVGSESVITSQPSDILNATRLVLPGVGTFDHGMSQLRNRGLIGVLEEAVHQRRIPILGICLGMQLLSHGSEEGVLEGLGWIPGRTVRFRRELAASGTAIKIPHMGWNNIRQRRPHPLLDDLPLEPRFYFVHSYHFVCERDEHALGVTEHGCEFTSVVASRNIVGTQFHPEKSHKYGISLLRNYIRGDFCAHIESDSLPAAERRRAG